MIGTWAKLSFELIKMPLFGSWALPQIRSSAELQSRLRWHSGLILSFVSGAVCLHAGRLWTKNYDCCSNET